MSKKIMKKPVTRKISCGAMLYTYNEQNEIGIILGSELVPQNNKLMWYPFKGVVEKGETFEETALREISEETNKLFTPDSIKLDYSKENTNIGADHIFIKTYKLGLLFAPFSIVEQYNSMDEKEKTAEKTSLKFFKLSDVEDEREISYTVKHCIRFYSSRLKKLSFNFNKVDKTVEVKIPSKSYFQCLEESD